MRQPRPATRIRAYLLGKDRFPEERTLEHIQKACAGDDSIEALQVELDALVATGHVVRSGLLYQLSDDERHQIIEDFRVALRMRGRVRM